MRTDEIGRTLTSGRSAAGGSKAKMPGDLEENLTGEPEDNAPGRSEKKIAGEPEENAAQEKEEMSVEEAFDRLEVLLQELEKSDLSLEASFAFYEEGMKLVKFCSDALDRVEKKVLVLSRDGELDEF